MKRKGRWMWVIFLLYIVPGVQVPAAPVPDTGQTNCYDADGNVITCPSPGQRFYGQDANYTINPPSYTKLDATGNDLPDSADSWVMVRDNVTDLIWEVKQEKDGYNSDNLHDADNHYSWYDPNPNTNGGDPGFPQEDGRDTNHFINTLNNERFGGFSDWRLPKLKELLSIQDYGRCSPAINITFFPNTMSSYWSSDTYFYLPAVAWSVNFASYDTGIFDKVSGIYIRAVRGGQ